MRSAISKTIELIHREFPDAKRAIRLQDQLSSKVIPKKTFEKISVIGAVDCSHTPKSNLGVAGIALYRFPELIELSHTVVEHAVTFPYVPGLLSFRELPLILAAVESLSQLPDLFLVDGQGIAHPRRFGIASHLGILLDIPTIGCAKSVLIGKGRPPAVKQGSWSSLKDKGETIGALVRARADAKPLVVSIGHRVDLQSAIEIVLNCCDGKRIPKPIRHIDRLVGEYRRSRSHKRVLKSSVKLMDREIDTSLITPRGIPEVFE